LVSANEGDVLVLFSDGITEAPNRREEQYGEERLIANDDQTLLVVRLWRAVDHASGSPDLPSLD
jgi:stage II sporulation SpoE-like protein